MKNNFNKKVRDYIKEIYYKYESCLCKKYNPILIHNNMNVLFLKLLNDSEIAYSGNNLVFVLDPLFQCLDIKCMLIII